MCIFFFFQAEDGIRDLTVTGVQTCALPIYRGDLAGEGCPLVAGLLRVCGGAAGALPRRGEPRLDLRGVHLPLHPLLAGPLLLRLDLREPPALGSPAPLAPHPPDLLPLQLAVPRGERRLD